MGLRARFPQFNYADILAAQHRLLTEGLGIRHVRLVIGNSMGGMLTWLWGATHPDFMDAIVPMAAQPTAMSGRNWMLRRMMIETIRRDPAYQGGDYSSQPASLSLGFLFFNIATQWWVSGAAKIRAHPRGGRCSFWISAWPSRVQRMPMT